jgi:hypothetical protein
VRKSVNTHKQNSTLGDLIEKQLMTPVAGDWRHSMRWKSDLNSFSRQYQFILFFSLFFPSLETIHPSSGLRAALSPVGIEMVGIDIRDTEGWKVKGGKPKFCDFFLNLNFLDVFTIFHPFHSHYYYPFLLNSSLTHTHTHTHTHIAYNQVKVKLIKNFFSLSPSPIKAKLSHLGLSYNNEFTYKVANTRWASIMNKKKFFLQPQ